MKAMILAAGLGTRLRPLTDNVPKALVEVGGVPMLERLILKLKASGMDSIVINVHHFASRIEDFLKRNDCFGMHIDISDERDAVLETGGGIRRAAKYLGDGRFLVHNVDMFTDIDLRAFMAEDSDDALATLMVAESVGDERYLLFDKDMSLAGWTNLRTGEVRSPYPNFDPSSCRRYSFCGIHIMSPRVPELMKGWPEKFSITDFYLAMAAKEKIRAVRAPSSAHIIDIGTPEKLALAGDMVSRLSGNADNQALPRFEAE